MSKKSKKESANRYNGVIIFFMWSVGIASAIMIGFYIWKFHDHSFSSNPEDWGNFGDYIGSITGLLAFLGVLYTAWDAKSESNKRDERDQYFNLLQLHNSNTNEVNCVVGEITFQGQKAFDKYANVVNTIIADYIVVNYIMETEIEKLREARDYCNYDDFCDEVCKMCLYIDQVCCNGEIGDYSAISFQSVKRYVLEEGHKFLMYKNLDKSGIKSDLGYSILHSYTKNNDYDAIYKMLKFVGNKLYDQAGYAFSQYFRNMFYLLESINDIKHLDKDFYFKTFRAQLSRSEIIICLVNSVSDKTSKKFVQYIRDNNILDDLYYNDLLLTMNEDRWKNHELEFVNNILDKYLADN